MDSFRLIQNFFSRMSCQYCHNHFKADDIELIREDHGIHVVSVYCHHCERQVGVAMVGVDAQGAAIEDMDDVAAFQRYADPELTETGVERLSQFDPINDDDVLAAHYFFNNLDENWTRLLPQPGVLTEADETAEADSISDEPLTVIPLPDTEL